MEDMWRIPASSAFLFPRNDSWALTLRSQAHYWDFLTYNLGEIAKSGKKLDYYSVLTFRRSKSLRETSTNPFMQCPKYEAFLLRWSIAIVLHYFWDCWWNYQLEFNSMLTLFMKPHISFWSIQLTFPNQIERITLTLAPKQRPATLPMSAAIQSHSLGPAIGNWQEKGGLLMNLSTE